MKKMSMYLEGIFILIIIIMTVSFAVRTFSDTPSIKECQKASASIEKIETKTNDPTQWVIESVSSDFSECEVTHGDGYTYTHEIHECYNEDNYLVVILDCQGQLHEFIFME